MPNYLVNTNAQPNGDHEVHETTCDHLPLPQHQLALGYFSTCVEAVRRAKTIYPQSNGCYYCSRPCNTG